jgi:hypothetical protein
MAGIRRCRCWMNARRRCVSWVCCAEARCSRETFESVCRSERASSRVLISCLYNEYGS